MFVICLYRIVYFFFFKQKTAYEMRISDWSSDVCSSDLLLRERVERRVLEQRPPCAAIECVVRLRRLPVAGFLVSVRCAQRRPLIEIGRASCRERVCQYV